MSKHYHDPPYTPAQLRSDEPIVRNACRCGVCGSGADRYIHLFQCQANPGHMGDLTVGIFSDLSRPE